MLETSEAYMRIDDSPPYSVILQQYRELSNAVVAAKEAKEQQLVGLLALKGMMDGVSQKITQCKGRGWALMVFSEVGGQGAWKVAQRLAAWGAQLLALDAQMAGGVASSSGGRSGSAQWSRSSSSGGNSLSKVKVMSVSNMGLWNLISLSHFWSILCNMSQIISIFRCFWSNDIYP